MDEAAPPIALAAHRKIAGRYSVERRLGRGGQAETFVALDDQTGTRVVLKRLSLKLAESWKAVELFEREAKILRTLEHPGIPTLVDAFHEEEEGGGHVFYLVQSLVEGHNLEETIAAGLRCEEQEAIALARSALEILQYLHGATPPIIHRDLKPANLIIGEGGKVSLVDFGAAQALIPAASAGGSTVVGTYGYMPPEQFAGRATPASDLYALGATLLYTLTGRHPSDLEMKRMRYEYRALVSISDAFAEFIDLLLEPAVEDRFESAGAALRALERFGKKSKKRKKRREKPRVERILEAGEGSWIRVLTTEDNASVEIPPLHNSRERTRAVISACALAATLSSIPVLGIVALPFALIAAVHLSTSLRSTRLLLGKKRYSLRRELLGVPYSITRGDMRAIWVKQERGPNGEPINTLSLWDEGTHEYRLAPHLDEDERAWMQDVLAEQLHRLRKREKMRALASGGEPRVPAIADWPKPEARPSLRWRINLFPARAYRRRKSR